MQEECLASQEQESLLVFTHSYLEDQDHGADQPIRIAQRSPLQKVTHVVSWMNRGNLI